MKQNSSQKTHKSRKTASEAPGKPRQSAKPTGTELITLPLDGPPPTVPATATPPASIDLLDAPQPVAPEKQWWFRNPDSKTRKLADKIAVHRAAGRDDKQIAKILKTTEQTVRQTVYLARKNRWFDQDDEPVDVEAEIAMNLSRKVVRNIDATLDGRMTNWQTHEMTIAAAKGFGVFKQHEVNKNEIATPNMVIGVQVVMPTLGAEDQKVDEIEIPDSMVGGVPAYIEGEVCDGPLAERLPAARAGGTVTTQAGRGTEGTG